MKYVDCSPATMRHMPCSNSYCFVASIGSSPLDWFEITLTITLDVTIYLKVGIYISLGFTKIEFTVYEKTWDYQFILLGPLRYGPEPIEKLAETSSSGTSSVQEVVLRVGDLICEHKGGSLGEEGEQYLVVNMFLKFVDH